MQRNHVLWSAQWYSSVLDNQTVGGISWSTVDCSKSVDPFRRSAGFTLRLPARRTANDTRNLLDVAANQTKGEALVIDVSRLLVRGPWYNVQVSTLEISTFSLSAHWGSIRIANAIRTSKFCAALTNLNSVMDPLSIHETDGYIFSLPTFLLWIVFSERMAGGGAFVRGVVTRHLSPYEQKLFVGFVKNAFTKVSGKVSRNFFDVVPAVGLGFATYYWTNSKYEEYQHSHRS